MANSKEWSRRDFLKVAGGSALAVGLLYVSIPQIQGEMGVARAASPGAPSACSTLSALESRMSL